MMAGNVKGIWIGVDVGTTGVRAIAYEASGVSLASAEAFYPLRTPHPDWAEERPSEILAATEQVVRETADVLRYQGRMPSGIAARAGEEPCCTYIGEDGAGHYVKMVHNGIEYADMQLIAETYLILKHVGGLSNARIGEIFHAWNSGELQSYLIGITADIFAEVDAETGAALVDIIVDRAGQKGTGRWTSLDAPQRGVDLSMISAACNARVLSNLTEERAHAGAVMTEPEGAAVTVDADFIEAVRRSLYTAKIVAYAQGFSLYRAAKEEFGWSLDFGRIASIFRAGCIIQAEFLQRITDAYEKEPNLKNLMFDDFFLSSINGNAESLRRTVCLAVERGVPIPAFSAAMQYIDAFRSPQLGANLIQAQRDYFGAHTFERVDKEGSFHHVWQEHYEK